MPRSEPLPTHDHPEISVVVPAYNEARNVPEFLRRTVPILREHTRSFEVIFALDPSTDDTDEVILEARRELPEVKLLVFSRRFGQPSATLAGIEHASGDAVLVMDVDLQDPPDLIPEMLAKWRDGYEVVYAQRRQRAGETWVKKLVARFGYWFINKFSDVDIPRDTGDFRLIDRRVVEQIRNFPEAHGFLRGMVALVGFRQVAVPFDRPARHSGRGNYNRFFGSLRIGVNGVVGFSTALLNMSTIIGLLAALLAFVTGVAYLGFKLAGTDFPVGNPTIVVLVLFVGGIQLICLGIIGLYVGRIYDEVKRRPRYIVDRSEGFSPDVDPLALPVVPAAAPADLIDVRTQVAPGARPREVEAP
jgi:dolichol-phosphate mannosyltransferase